MITRYTTALSFMGLAMLASAQWVRDTPARATFSHATAEPLRVKPMDQGQPKAGGDVVFYEDFANGLAGNNGVGAWTLAEQDGAVWSFHTTGPNGAYSNPAQQIIQSESVANGFMLFGADSANCTWSGGTPTPLPVTSFVNWTGALVSPVIDLSATPYVQLQFQQALRYCCGDSPFYVQVSTNGGTSWPYSFEVSGGTAVNTGVNIDVRAVNITQAIAGNPSNVQFRFIWDGGAAGTSHYYWQVDDVRIIELYDYDLSMMSSAITKWDPATANTYDSLRYSVFPYGQLRPMGLNMTVLNNGSQAQTGVTANFKVMQGGNTVLNQDQAIANFPAGDIQTVFVNPDFTPPATTGTYDVTYTITGQTDNTPNDNSGTGQFKVAQYTYARDMGTVADFEDGSANNDPYELCNGFHIANEADLYSVDVALRSGSTPSPVGLLIRGTLRTGDLTTIIDQTDDHEIVSGDLNGANGNKFISLVFSAPQPLDAGSDYIVCIEHLGGGPLRTGVNGVSEAQSSFIYYNGSNGLDWYYTTSTPMVRMNFDPSVGITEADRVGGVGLGQNMPNPADASTVVAFDLKEAGATTMELRDLSGKLVRVNDLGVRGVGAHRVTVHTADLTEGVYFYTLTSGGQRLTKRMTVVH